MRFNLTKIIRKDSLHGVHLDTRVSARDVRGRRSTTFSVRGGGGGGGDEAQVRLQTAGEGRAVEVEGGRREVLIGVGTRGGEGISGYIRLRTRWSTLPRACEEKGPTKENSSSLFPRCLRASSGWGVF